MSTSAGLSDESLRIPKLEIFRTNWVIYKERFVWALDARGIVDHIDGTGSEPVDPISGEEVRKEALSPKQIKSDTEWKSGEVDTKQQIASSIPDSLFLKIRSNGSAFDIWKLFMILIRRINLRYTARSPITLIKYPTHPLALSFTTCPLALNHPKQLPTTFFSACGR